MFDRAVCLALDKKLIKKEISIVHQLEPFGIKVDYFVVGQGKIYPSYMYDYIDQDVPQFGRKQAFNYASSLLKIIRRAKDNKWKNILFLEDDAVLTDKFPSMFPKSIKELQDHNIQYDMLFIGGNHRNGPIEEISKHIIKPSYSLDMHAVVFNHTIYDMLLEIKPSWELTLDGIIGDKQKRGLISTYAFHPSLITQKDGWSENEQRFVSRRENHDL